MNHLPQLLIVLSLFPAAISGCAHRQPPSSDALPQAAGEAEPPSTASATPTAPDTIPVERSVSVHLQAGFDGSSVVLIYNGREIYRGSPKTRGRLGFAVEIPFERGEEITGVLEVSAQGVNHRLTIDWTTGRAVGISIVGKEIRVQQRRIFIYA